MKKVFIIMLSLVLVLTIFITAGCNNKGKEVTKETTEEATKEEHGGFDFTPEGKTIVIWNYSSSPEETTVVSFIQQNPGYHVDNTTTVTAGFWPDKSQDLPKLSGAVAAGTPPDLFLCSNQTPVEAYYTNLFMPLDDFFKYDPDYNTETIDSRVHEAVTFNDKIYFAPKGITVDTIIWDKDLFENVGLDPEKAPRTWSELKEYNEKLLTYDSTGNIKTIGMKDQVNYFHIFHIVAFGEQYTDKYGINLNINTENYNKTLEFYSSLSDVFGGSDKLPSGVSEAIVRWNEGALYLYTGIYNNDKFGISYLPKPDDQEEDFVPYTVINYYGIPKTAKNPRGGWKFLKYLHTDAIYDDQIRWYSLGPNTFIPDYISHMPTREKLYDELLSLLDDDRLAIVEKRDEIVRSANIPVYDIALSCEFANYRRAEVEKVTQNLISPKDFLINAQSYGESIIKEFKSRKEAENWVFNDDGTAYYKGDEESAEN